MRLLDWRGLGEDFRNGESAESQSFDEKSGQYSDEKEKFTPGGSGVRGDGRVCGPGSRGGGGGGGGNGLWKRGFKGSVGGGLGGGGGGVPFCGGGGVGGGGESVCDGD